MNSYQTQEEIIKNATAEQRILWNYIFLRFGEKIGITQLYYAGLIAGSEFLNYSVNKLYFVLGVVFSVGGIWPVQLPQVNVYNEANSIINIFVNSTAFWDATAANYVMCGNTINSQSFVFSRISSVVYTTIKILGYRLSI